MLIEKDARLPCAQELAEYGRVNMPITLDYIDGNWTKLDMSPSAPINLQVIDNFAVVWQKN